MKSQDSSSDSMESTTQRNMTYNDSRIRIISLKRNSLVGHLPALQAAIAGFYFDQYTHHVKCVRCNFSAESEFYQSYEILKTQHLITSPKCNRLHTDSVNSRNIPGMTISTPSILPGLIDNDLIPNVRQLSSPDEDVDDPRETDRVRRAPPEDGTTVAHRTSPNNSYRGDQVPPVDRIPRLHRQPSGKTKKNISVATVRVAKKGVRERHKIDTSVQKRNPTDTRVRERDSTDTRVRVSDSIDTRLRERDSTDTRVRERNSTDTRVRQRDSTDTRVRQRDSTDTRVRQRDSNDTRVRQRDSNDTRVRQRDSTDTRVQERNPTDTRVRERDSIDTRVRQRDSNDTGVRQRDSNDTRVRQRDSTDTRVQERNPTDTRVRERDSIDTRVQERNQTDTRVRERDSNDTRVRQRHSNDTRVRQCDSNDTRVRVSDSIDTRVRASSAADKRLEEEFKKLENTEWFLLAKGLSLKEKYVDEAVRRQMLTGEPFSGPKSLMHAVLEVEHEEFGGTTEETESPNSTDQPIAGCSRRESRKKKPHSAAKVTETTSSSLTAMLQEEAELIKARQCLICVTEEMSVVFLPCGHFCCCSICAPSLHRCPKCRIRIDTAVRVNSL